MIIYSVYTFFFQNFSNIKSDEILPNSKKMHQIKTMRKQRSTRQNMNLRRVDNRNARTKNFSIISAVQVKYMIQSSHSPEKENLNDSLYFAFYSSHYKTHVVRS